MWSNILKIYCNSELIWCDLILLKKSPKSGHVKLKIAKVTTNGTRRPNWTTRQYGHIYRNKISCAYWLLSVNCLLGSHYLNEGVSHHRQISSLLNRILAPFTCHQENSSITTLRASLPTTIIILSDVFLVDGFLHICPPSEDSLFVARGSILFMPESPDAAQIEW